MLKSANASSPSDDGGSGNGVPSQPARKALVEVFASEILGILRERKLHRKGESAIASLSMDEAYAVQTQVLAVRVANGERVVGWKVGCTSPSIQHQFGLQHPICGRLLSPQIYPDGALLPAAQFVDCAVEAELVFRMRDDIHPGMTDGELRNAIDSVCPGIELHHYRFWYGNPTIQELIASNGIHAGLVIGASADPDTLDFNAERMRLVVNNNVEAEGNAGEIMGGPLHSLRWLAQHTAERGKRVSRGDLVIPGSAVKLVRISAGDAIEARFSSIGSCRTGLV